MRPGPKWKELPDSAPGSALKTAIRAELEARGWSQRELAERAGLPQKQVSQILTGKIEGSLGVLERMAAVVGLRISVDRIDGERQ